ncbi:ImmA/IrrE family metallo-endopeptidase [Planctomycetota bacterium]
MNNKVELARSVIHKALRIRQTQGIKLYESLCVYDLLEKLKVMIHFDSLPSTEGIYINESPPRIILSSLRPYGRTAYNCAHELGHHVFGHGTRVDELHEGQNAGNFNTEEYIANCFASFLLMPKLAVSHGFAKRHWSISDCRPEQFYIISGWLGVGYTTLIKHMCYSLNMLSRQQAEKSCKTSLKKIRKALLCQELPANLIVVDREWTGRPIDIQVGDSVLVKNDIKFEGKCVEPCSYTQIDHVFQGVRPGIGRFYSNDKNWAAFVRVSRKEYTGQCRYRHLEDPEDE